MVFIFQSTHSVSLSGATSLELGIRYSITWLSVRFRTIGLKLKLDLIECACCLKNPLVFLPVSRGALLTDEGGETYGRRT